MTERITSLRVGTHPRDPMRNVVFVTVVGRLGRFDGHRKDLTLARATARKYGRLLDAPHSCF